MELSNWPSFDFIVTTLVVTSAVSLFSSLAGGGWPNSPKRFVLSFVPLFAFAMLGFVTGLIMGDSRESAVTSVVPAVLIWGTSGVRCWVQRNWGADRSFGDSFAFSLLVGVIFGSRVRSQFEIRRGHPDYLRARDIVLEQNKPAAEVQRLEGYIEEKKLDLSRFESAFEKHDTDTKDANAVKSEPTKTQSFALQKKGR